MKLKWFTLVELIVVITIVSILSTVWFVSYTDYLRGVRDGTRIQQLSSLHKALELYSVKLKLPVQNDAVEIFYWTSLIWTQGDLNQSVLDSIRYSDGWVDPRSGEFFTYLISADRKNSQLLGFFEEKNTEISIMNVQTYAADEYSNLFPKVVWSNLWIMLEEETNIPIHKLWSFIDGWVFDIVTQSGSYVAYLNSNEIIGGDCMKKTFWLRI